MTSFPLLSIVVFTPWIGAVLLAVWRSAPATLSRALAMAFSLSTLLLGVLLWARFDPTQTGMQFEENEAWISSLAIHYHLGLDGLSLVLVLLTGIVTPVALVATWHDPRQPRFVGVLFLLAQGSALGVFLALDFFPWFLFWELSLIPVYFLIKLWGGPGATRAAYQFVVYTIGGSAFLLLAFAALLATTGTADFVALAQLAASGELDVTLADVGAFWPTAIFVGVFLGVAVKVPLWPFHTWLPPAYAEAPTAASMFLTGVMSKMGVYGFLRLLWPIFPEQLHRAAPCLLWLALAGVVFGALAAMRQRDLKRMVAYSSVNHLSYCLLALFAVAAATGTPAYDRASATAALSGTIFQVFNHGLSAAALFYCVGLLEARSGGRRGLDDFGGLRTIAPIFAGLAGIALFSSLGLPGLNGFVGEFLIFRGVFGLAPWAAGVACLGLLATAWFLLTFWQRVFHGPKAGATLAGFRDVHRSEYLALLPLVALMFLLGVAPQLLAAIFNPLVTAWAGAAVMP
ncbi:NADH-quinone oxidoreductase subunit M [Opitutus sp. ER46]|uniref:complex I subunit 4 family protein n=1 Tax=Opitutus sp. ER46 TaxID=2161864 RepID=UPI000D2F77B1|nr:NADH-quinone oxidoreductase subunit M [Opitutus sp. ER46]PTX90692.1 NADH-quinone oxidoreductase subunit L [Opitutus sp. ER46]